MGWHLPRFRCDRDQVNADSLVYGARLTLTGRATYRPFGDLMDEDVVLGVERAMGSMVEPVQIEGLCNAVILAKPNAPFMKRWYDAYATFDSDQW
jgi:hypothetical protein